jgi:hypothetical protein
MTAPMKRHSSSSGHFLIRRCASSRGAKRRIVWPDACRVGFQLDFLTSGSPGENGKGTDNRSVAMVHRKKADHLSDPGPLLRAMLPCRKAMIDAMSSVKPMGTIYHGLGMVVAAIDGLATLLVGREGYFWAPGSAPTNSLTKGSGIERETDADEAGPAP